MRHIEKFYADFASANYRLILAGIAMMSSPIDRKDVLARLHFAGHHISQEALGAIWTALSTLEDSAQQHTLSRIIYKLD